MSRFSHLYITLVTRYTALVTRIYLSSVKSVCVRDGAYSDDRSQIQSFIKINFNVWKTLRNIEIYQLKLLLEFIFGFELFQNNEILRTAGKLKFTGESVLNKLSTNFINKKKRYYSFTNMVVHYLCINDVINEKTKVLQLRQCLFLAGTLYIFGASLVLEEGSVCSLVARFFYILHESSRESMRL